MKLDEIIQKSPLNFEAERYIQDSMLLNKTHGCESKSSTVGKPPLQASGDKMDSRTDPIAQKEKSLNKSVNHNFFLKLVFKHFVFI